MKKRTFVKLFSVLLSALMVLGAIPLVSAEGLPEKTEGYNRYYFYMPEDWKHEYTDTAGIYWWESSEVCPSWPGYKANDTSVEGVYYYDVPKDVTSIIWNNYFDGSSVGEGAYEYVHQTEIVNSDYYDTYQSDIYVDGLDSFDNMIYVLDYTKIDINDFAWNIEYEGEWFYYYGDGKYGTTKIEADAPQVYTSETVVIDDVPPQYDESVAFAEFDLDTGDYSVTSGDEFCYTVMITASEIAHNLCGVIYYDSHSLELLSPADEMSPQGSPRYEIDTETPGEIRFELSSNNGGLAYMEGRVFVNIMFRALNDENSEIKVDFETMYLGGNMYIIRNGRIYDESFVCDMYIADAPTADANKWVNRYYFYMPEEWKSENPYTETPGIWWMRGTDVPRWPGNKLVATETDGVYYYDVPRDVDEIIWNNFIDRGIDEDAEIYSADYRTREVRSDFYEPGENDIYPDGVESFDNMIYVIDLTRTYFDDYQQMTFFEGEWFYYYGNGEYGTAVDKEDALIVYNEDNTELSMVPPQGENIPEGTLTVNCGGKSYEFEFGDTFYYTARLESKKGIDYLALRTNYDSDLLKFTELEEKVMFPNLGYSFPSVHQWESAVSFNSSLRDDSYKFSDEKTVATYKFEVRGVGECDLESVFTSLSDFYNKDFVDDSGNITEEGIVLTEYITEEPYVGKTTIECGGKTYTFNVGEMFTYTAMLSSEEPVTDFFGRITVGGSKILETPEEERYPNIYYDKGDPEIYFTGQPRGGCDFTTPAVFIQYELQATEECKTVIETAFVELNGYVPDEEGNLPWDYTLTEIITPYSEEYPEVTVPSTDDEGIISSDFELGDVNKDGKLNIKDATAIQKFLAKLLVFDEEALVLADYTGDSVVNIKDATTIQKKLANLI